MNTIARLSYLAPRMELSSDLAVVLLWAALGLCATALIVHVSVTDIGAAMAMLG